MAVATPTVKPKLTLAERDRRYARIRELLRERAIDCAIVTGTNLFYLTNGISGQRLGLLPTDDGEPFMVALNNRHLADLPAQFVVDSQDWVGDVRSGNDAAPLIDRIGELKLEKGTIGFSEPGIAHNLHTQVANAFPQARLVDVSDMFLNVRTIKSDEEVAMIEHANGVFDAGVDGIYRNVRPGMTGAEAVQEGIKAMWAAGGDVNTLLSFNFGPVARQNPVLADLCLTKPVQWGDVGTLTAHAHYGQYSGHSDQEIVFGEPSALHKNMFDAVLHVREHVLQHVKPGATQSELIEVYRQACQETGFRSSPHSQIHQYGIDVPEFPGPAFRRGDGKSEGGRDYRLEAGMIYSISPTIVAPNEDQDTILGGTSLVVTESGYRELGDRKVEMLVVK